MYLKICWNDLSIYQFSLTVSLDVVEPRLLLSSIYNIKRVGYLVVMQAICDIQLRIDHIRTRTWHDKATDQIGASDSLSCPIKGRSRMLHFTWPLSTRVVNRSVTMITFLGITDRHPQPTSGPVWKGGVMVLTLCRGVVGVFYSPGWLGGYLNG